VDELEGALERFFYDEVRRAGGRVIKLAPTTAGIPDRLVFLPGRMELVELKTETGKLSPVQIVWHDRLFRSWGIRVTVLHGKQEIRSWISRTFGASVG
jgi:hypothetical protein